MGMVEKWANLNLECDPYIFEFGTHQEHCQFAVKLALPSRRVEGDAGLLTKLINHHSGATIKELRGIHLSEAAIRTYTGRRLLTSWLDFRLRREMIKTAQATLQPQVEDSMQLPEDVMAGTTDPSASEPSTSAVMTAGYDGTWPNDTFDSIESAAEADNKRVSARKPGAMSCVGHATLY